MGIEAIRPQLESVWAEKARCREEFRIAFDASNLAALNMAAEGFFAADEREREILLGKNRSS